MKASISMFTGQVLSFKGNEGGKIPCLWVGEGGSKKKDGSDDPVMRMFDAIYSDAHRDESHYAEKDESEYVPMMFCSVKYHSIIRSKKVMEPSYYTTGETTEIYESE